MLDCLIEMGKSQFCPKYGRIPLHYVAMRGWVDVVKKLINVQSNSIWIVLDGNETVLHLCVKYNKLEALKL